LEQESNKGEGVSKCGSSQERLGLNSEVGAEARLWSLRTRHLLWFCAMLMRHHRVTLERDSQLYGPRDFGC